MGVNGLRERSIGSQWVKRRGVVGVNELIIGV